MHISNLYVIRLQMNYVLGALCQLTKLIILERFTVKQELSKVQSFTLEYRMQRGLNHTVTHLQ